MYSSNAGLPRVVTDINGASAISPSNVWVGWNTDTASIAAHWDGHRWHTLTTPSDVDAYTGNIVPDGKGGYWFGTLAIMTGSRWTSVPPIEISGGIGGLVRIPGTESFVLPATVQQTAGGIQRPTLYRFDL
jgi:hypothetical protein